MVNVAARLKALTKQEAYPLLLSQTTLQLVGQHDGVISLGLRQLRGRDERLEIFALQRTGASKAESM